MRIPPRIAADVVVSVASMTVATLSALFGEVGHGDDAQKGKVA